MEKEAFLYSVKPKKPIIGIPGVPVIRIPKSLYLTREDVELCLTKGTVIRRFTADIAERVTIDNVDRMHRAEYIPEDKWEDFLAGKVEVKKEEIPTPAVEETAKEEVIEDITEEETVDEVAEEEEIETEIEEETQEEAADLTPVEETTEEETVESDDEDPEETEEA